MIELAKQLALHFHRDQKYGEYPYSKHLNDVVNGVIDLYGDDEELIIIAWLHDIVEDTSMTTQILFDVGFSHDVIMAIGAITKREGQSRSQYLSSVSNNKKASKVKYADARSNMWQCLEDGDEKRADYYNKTMIFLLDYIS